MTLEPAQILEKIKNPNPDLVVLKADHKRYLMHVHGIGVTEYLTKVEGLESDIKIALRRKLARSNKDLFADVLRPTDKIFNSQGGSKNYHLTDKKKLESFIRKLSDVKNNMSLTQWLETYFVDKYVVDPNGLFLVENKDSEAWPTYKSIFTIHDYEQDGNGIKYFISHIRDETEKRLLRSDKESEFYRVYDDSGDFTYKRSGDSLQLIEAFPNPWGRVPAVLCSDVINPLTDHKQSAIYEQVGDTLNPGLAEEYLRETSIKTLFKYHHGFPYFWQYMSICKVCKGSGSVNNTGCTACNKTGWAMKKDVSDVTYLEPPEQDTPIIAPNLAGYVVPPIDSWKQMTEELKLLRDMIFHSQWGIVINREDSEKTAFEVNVNLQPLQDRLNFYTTSLESVETDLTDLLGKFYFQDSYDGSSISYGRNYLIKSANQLLVEYLEEKGKNASYTVLNDKLSKYYDALYAHDPFSLVVFKKLIMVEPWIHNTISEVKEWELSNTDFANKLYYNAWLSIQPRDNIFKTEVEKLQSELSIFTNQKAKDNERTEVQRVRS